MALIETLLLIGLFVVVPLTIFVTWLRNGAQPPSPGPTFPYRDTFGNLRSVQMGM